MEWKKDIAAFNSINPGSFRSLNGAADEYIFIGRALKAGFTAQQKAWRDAPYDASIHYGSTLDRIEVKGSSDGTFNVTRGGRAGKQINKQISKTRVISRKDCDFVAGVCSDNGTIYIIPTDVIEIINKQNLSTKTLSVFREKWELFMPDKTNLSPEQTRDGLRTLSLHELEILACRLGITLPNGEVRIVGTRSRICDPVDIAVYTIWTELAARL